MCVARLHILYVLGVIWLLTCFHCACEITTLAHYSKRPATEMSIRNITNIIKSVWSTCSCAAMCSRIKPCTAFVYSSYEKVCRLGFGVLNERNSMYKLDYLLFKSELGKFFIINFQ